MLDNKPESVRVGPNSPLDVAFIQVLIEPTPTTLWQLRGGLLEAGVPGNSQIMEVVDNFYHFLNELVASSTARQFSHCASLLDLGAVAGVALQNLLATEDSDDWWQRAALGAFSEVLMVLAARQYVKAWEEEMRAQYNSAAWYLCEQYWSLSANLQPDLPAGHRRQLVEQLVAPIKHDQVQGTARAALAVHLYQLLLLLYVKMPARILHDENL